MYQKTITRMSLTLTILFIVLQSLFALTKGQTCRNLPVYTPCSTNPNCGCLPFSSSNDQSGICAYLHLNASKLRMCSETNYYCDQPYTVCVHHPNISIDRPLCYPTGMATLDLCPLLDPISTLFPLPIIPVEEICFNVSWAKRGITVAGSNFSGTALDQLRGPTAILFDLKTNTLYISDNGNARIVTWQLDGKRGSIVAGDNGQGNRTDQLGWISDMLMDPKDGSLIICDAQNRRIIRWSRRAQEGKILIDKLYCTGLALDDQGLLYVAEHDNHRISRWILGENITNDQVVAGGNGKGNRLDQLYEPSAVFVDGNRTVYVADYSNDRIMKWTEGAKQGIIIGSLRVPRTVHLDQSGNIYSIDGYHSRVVRWTPKDVNSTVIIGAQQYTLSQATDLAFDQHENVFVSNHGTGRIDKFDIDRSACP
ncbi:unnamed protein product [Rotaria sordida]|uniref:Uncharacterized protein n=2 Tax=Rotaria sordida TaxID=392033 RepID=A0A814KUV7_9BILA|nr:unnamed protein product [Rotaria sordida]